MLAVNNFTVAQADLWVHRNKSMNPLIYGKTVNAGAEIPPEYLHRTERPLLYNYPD
jgi:hypothetical protein